MLESALRDVGECHFKFFYELGFGLFGRLITHTLVIFKAYISVNIKLVIIQSNVLEH